MPHHASIKVVHCVLCDDVRTEIFYKETVVGVYSAGMTVPTVPWTASVCVWLTVIWSGDGNLGLEIRVLNPQQTPAGELAGRGTAVWQGHESTITFRGLLISIDMEGIYLIQWRPVGGEWIQARQFPVYILRPS